MLVTTKTILVALAAFIGLPGARPAPVAVTAPPPTAIGVNLTSINWYSQQRAFANLAIGDSWRLAVVGKRWEPFPAAYISSDGGLTALPTGSNAVRMLTKPDTGPAGVDIRCTWQGDATITAKGVATKIVQRRNSLTFHWVNDWSEASVWVQVTSLDPRAPLRELDCRETTMAQMARFDPAFVKSLAGFKVLRFMDWQRANLDAAVQWNSRNSAQSIELDRADGVSVEDMVSLAKQVGAAPWFALPWNADADYVRRFAQYVHDTLPADRDVYVELGNEIWNQQFPAAKQATAEGLAAGLSSDAKQANAFRYAQRVAETMTLWESVFADRPGHLVRVAATQHVSPQNAELVLGYRDTAAHVDALATAPYFGLDIMQEGQTDDLAEIFRRLDDRIRQTIATAEANKAVAARFGKRYIAYEAGQHIVLPYNVPLTELIQRDPRMYRAYKAYIAAWRTRIGDMLTIFATVGRIGRGGAWGLAEHSGQPASEAPKLRAVLEEQSSAR